jgi:CRISPR/Cas system CSM-associated protein Csm3 (group 7 of RAMP superfamily)
MKHQIKGIITTLSPLHHGSDESAGIDRLYRRMDIYVDGKLERVPIISGNSIRGLMRDLLAYDLIQKLELEKLSLNLYDLLFSGGTLQKGAITGKIEIEKINWIREKFPFLRLFGGSIGNHIMQGEFQCGIAWIIAKETFQFTEIETKESYIKFFSEDFGTRQDNSLNDSNLIEKNSRKDPMQMKYNSEIIIPGVQFSHEFTINTSNDLVLSCFLQGLELLQSYSRLGGKSNIGYGKVSMKYNIDGLQMDGQPYREYILKNQLELQDAITKII